MKKILHVQKLSPKIVIFEGNLEDDILKFPVQNFNTSIIYRIFAHFSKNFYYDKF